MTVSANEVKKRGVSIFDEMLKKFNEIVITFRAKRNLSLLI
ncbi:hypothetical protein [Nautilia lithotrophica]